MFMHVDIVYLIFNIVCTPCLHVGLGLVPYVTVKSVNSSSLDISWGPAQLASGVTSHYLVWVNSSSQLHMASVPAPAQNVIVSQLGELLSQ